MHSRQKRDLQVIEVSEELMMSRSCETWSYIKGSMTIINIIQIEDFHMIKHVEE